MKKYLVFFIMFFFSALVVNAGGTKEYIIDAYIQSNGDMLVIEKKKLSGSYNGISTILRFANYRLPKFTGILNDFEGSRIYNASDLVDLKVYSSSTNNLNDISKWKEFNQVYYAEAGDYGVYIKNYRYTASEDLKIYQPSSYNEYSIVTYMLKDVVVVHEDVAEIAWDFIDGTTYEEDIDSLIITVHLPDENTRGNLRVFSHGPLTSENDILDDKTVIAKYYNLKAGKYPGVDVRVVFDKSMVINATKKSNINGLEFILEVEEARAAKANELREEAKSRVFLSNVIAGVSMIGFIGMGAFIYKRYDKEHSSNFYHQYNRDFIDDYNVEIVDYVMTKDISQKAFAASIMNLVYKKYLTVEKEMTKGIFGKQKETYIFVKTNKECTDDREKYLLDFLINEIGTGESFTADTMKKYAESKKTYEKFTLKYNTWKAMAEGEAKALNIFENHSNIKVLFVLVAIVIIGLNFNSLTNIATLISPFIAIIIGIVFIIYVCTFTKRTELGNEHYLRWRAFKNFLQDFGAFKEKDLPEIVLWERYLVYATVFGIADKVQKEMKVKITEIVPESQMSTFDTFIWHSYAFNSLNRGVSSSFQAAHNTAMAVNAANAASIAGSSRSSGGGFGGGGSFGGGGFGGGGSGGGRF